MCKRVCRALIAAVLVGMAAATAAPAAAEPAEDPCSLTEFWLCRFLPIAPELDGDIDLTQRSPAADPGNESIYHAPLPGAE